MNTETSAIIVRSVPEAVTKPKADYEYSTWVYGYLLEPVLRSIKKEIVAIAERYSFQNILDLCCGTGAQCILLHNKGFRVSGVDSSEAMIRMARESSPGGIHYFREDARHLHFEDRTFDCVILSFALHEKTPDDRKRVLGEAHRVTTSGGKLLIADYVIPTTPISKMMALVQRAVERKAGGDHFRNFKQFMGEGGLRGVISKFDLSELEIHSFHHGATGVLVAEWV